MILQRATILVMVLIAIGSAPADAQTGDLLGVFFDEAGTQTSINTTEPNQFVPFYLILLDPSHAEGVHSWECIIEPRIEGQAYLVDWQLRGEAITYDQPPRFIVSLSTPLPQEEAVVLMSATAVVVDPDTEVLFYLHSYDPPSLTDPPPYGYPVTTPLYGYGNDNYQPLGWTSGCESEPVARINDDGVDPVWSPPVLPETIDFGMIPAGQSEIRSLHLTNSGDVALSGQIDVSGDGFTFHHSNILWVDEPRWFWIGPGDALLVQVRLEPTSDEPYTGELMVSVCGETAACILEFDGSLGPACTVTPESWNFGEVPVGSADQHMFRIRNVGGEFLEGQASIPAACSTFSLVDGGEPFSLGYNQFHDFIVRFEPDAPGLYLCTISVSVDCDSIGLSGAGFVPSPCMVTPWYCNFGELVIGETDHCTFQVQNIGDEVLTGQVSIPDDCQGFELLDGGEPFSLGHNEIHDFTILFRSRLPEPYSCTVSVSADCSIDLAGTGVARVESCSLTPEAIDFGDVWLGFWEERELTVRNEGNVHILGSLQIRGSGPSPPEGFTIEGNGEFTLAPGADHIFTVRFSPEYPRGYQAYVTTDLPGSPVVRLTGSCPDYLPDCWDYAEGMFPIVATEGTPGSANGVAVVDNLAFVADGEAGLQVIDVSDAMYPQPVGSIDTPGSANNVVVSGDVAYVADGDSGLQIVDISDPTSPQLFPGVDTGLAQDVAVGGDHAYVAGDAFTVVDISQPGSSWVVAAVDTAAVDYYMRGVAVSSGHAYVAATEENGWGDLLGRVLVIDVTDPENPQIVNILNYGEYWDYEYYPACSDVAVAGNKLYAMGADLWCTGGPWNPMCFSYYLKVYDISIPAQPSYLHCLTRLVGGGCMGWGYYSGRSLAIAGDLAYLTTWGDEDRLEVLDISSGLSVRAAIQIDYWADITTGGGFVYAADPGEGMHILLPQCEDKAAIAHDSPSPGSDKETPSAGLQLAVHPNPFNPQTTITFVLERGSHVEIGVFDLTGRRIRTLTDIPHAPGTHSLIWDGKTDSKKGVPSGTYLVRLETESAVMSRKVMLLR